MKFKTLFLAMFFVACNTVPMSDYDVSHLEGFSKATFSGGCFWCMEPAFEAMDGVEESVSGYIGGGEEDAFYKEVVSGDTGHREAVQVYYDAEKVKYDDLLESYWRQIDPTDAGGQFADRGEQYKTAIYYHTEDQRVGAQAAKEDLELSGKFDTPVVTEVLAASEFFPAEEEHQDFYKKQSDHYKRYKKGSGRTDFIDDNWK